MFNPFLIELPPRKETRLKNRLTKYRNHKRSKQIKTILSELSSYPALMAA